jgi:serine/threonine-protein kinase
LPEQPPERKEIRPRSPVGDPETVSGFSPNPVAAPSPLVASLLQDQCECWRQGQRIPAEAYLQRYPALNANRDVVLNLLCNEMLLREQAGQALLLEDYVQRFPHLAPDLRRLYGPGPAADAAAPPVPAAGGSRVSNAETLSAVPPRRKIHVGGAPGFSVGAGVPGYEILAALGRGGMGIVYKASHLRLKRLVALKMVLAGSGATPEQLTRFRTEAEAVARLQHPNIVQIYEVGEHEDLPFLALEYVEGGSLVQRLQGFPQPVVQAAGWIAVLAGAVEHAHQRGIIHRDLKPANVLLSADGTPKITDFGLAKLVHAADGLTQSGAILGTPNYMAPEQAAGTPGAVSPAVDVYALGAILYEMLTGRPPFRAETPQTTLLQVLCREPVRPTHLRPDCPPRLESICLKCLRKDPRRRYPSAAALAEDLRAFLADPAPSAHVAGTDRRWRSRDVVFGALLLGNTLATITLAFLFVVGWQAAPRAPWAPQPIPAGIVEPAGRAPAAVSEKERTDKLKDIPDTVVLPPMEDLPQVPDAKDNSRLAEPPDLPSAPAKPPEDGTKPEKSKENTVSLSLVPPPDLSRGDRTEESVPLQDVPLGDEKAEEPAKPNKRACPLPPQPPANLPPGEIK